MKRFVSFCFLFICIAANSQNHIAIQKRIDSLKSLKHDYEIKIQELNTKIKDLENSKIISSYEQIKNFQYSVPGQPILRIRDKDNSSGAVLYELKKGDILTLIDFNDDIDYWMVSYNGNIGYVNDVLIQQNSAVLDYKNYLQAIKEQQKREKEELELENARKADEAKKVAAQKAEERRKIEEQKNEENAKRLALEETKKAKEWKDSLVQKYGKEVADKIIAKKIWIGMTREMAMESWGYPEDINRSVGSWGVHEQWVYSNNRYLYIENGILTSWQD